MPRSQVAAGLDGLGHVGLEAVVNLEHMARNRNLGVICIGVMLICVSKSNVGHMDINKVIHSFNPIY